MTQKRVTLRDVAKQAGVSVGSVSRFLNNHPSLSAKARTAIEGAIAKLNFIPNQMAQKLAKGISGNLLLYIYQEFPIFKTTWLYELPIIHGIYDVLQGTPYSLQIAMASVSDPEQFKRDIARQIESRLVDGMLILSSWPLDRGAMFRLMDAEFPFALIGTGNPVEDGNSIQFDNEAAVAELTGMLQRMGHRDIGFFGGYREQLHSRERHRGFLAAMAAAGLPVREEWVDFGDYSFESGVEYMDRLLAGRPPTAVIAGNDFIAAGIMRSVKKHNLSVPDDISVTGFDDLTMADIMEPGLTTVSIPLFEMGRTATRELVGCIAGKTSRFPSQTIQCNIVERASTSTYAARKSMAAPLS